MCSPHKQHTHSIEKNEAAAVFFAVGFRSIWHVASRIIYRKGVDEGQAWPGVRQELLFHAH